VTSPPGTSDHQRTLVLIGGVGTGKSNLAARIALACIRNGRRPGS